jgi:hypothetical protein
LHEDSNSQNTSIPSTASKFRGCLLAWPSYRLTRSFNVRVVEPEACESTLNGEIFRAAVNSLFETERSYVNSTSKSVAARPPAIRVDLLTFPEAFLSPADLIAALVGLGRSPPGELPCIHLGLRASSNADGHLFSVSAIKVLLAELTPLGLIETDLAPFHEWVEEQADDHYFNLGCLFTWDAHGNLRLCLQPKMVRSKYENSQSPEHRMKEGNLLTLVTLLPADRALTSVTIQPVLCSDVLDLSTDSPNARPLEAVNHAADCFPAIPPDHIDIVSVGTQTPTAIRSSGSSTRPAWHQDFLHTLVRAAEDDAMARHRHATFVLSNFRSHKEGRGGLSGAFISCQSPAGALPPFVALCCYGKPKSDGRFPNEWYFPADEAHAHPGWSSRGYLAYLDPPGNRPAYMLEFTIDRLLRDVSRWRSPQGLVDFKLHHAEREPTHQELVFRKWNES